MEQKIQSITNNFEKKLIRKKSNLFSITPQSASEAEVIISYKQVINNHLSILEILHEESEDTEYIYDNKDAIKHYFNELKEFIESIPDY